MYPFTNYKCYVHMCDPSPSPLLPQDGAMMRDVILAIRADEAHHRLVNHTFSNMQMDEMNPYRPGQ